MCWSPSTDRHGPGRQRAPATGTHYDGDRCISHGLPAHKIQQSTTIRKVSHRSQWLFCQWVACTYAGYEHVTKKANERVTLAHWHSSASGRISNRGCTQGMHWPFIIGLTSWLPRNVSCKNDLLYNSTWTLIRLCTNNCSFGHLTRCRHFRGHSWVSGNHLFMWSQLDSQVIVPTGIVVGKSCCLTRVMVVCGHSRYESEDSPSHSALLVPPPPCACTALSKQGVGVEPPF